MTTLTWNTATEWDAGQSDSGTVHEATTNTDHDDATIIKQGYPYASFDIITPTPTSAWPFHEDSGSTANDLAGTNDGSISGATVGVTGLLGTTAFSFDGTDDVVDMGNILDTVFESGDFTIVMWANMDSTVKGDMFDFSKTVVQVAYNDVGADNFHANIYDGSHNVVDSGVTTTGAWLHHAAVYDSSASQLEYFIDATSKGTVSSGQPSDVNDADVGVGAKFNGNDSFSGDIAEVRVYDAALTSSQIQTLYDVVDTKGTHKTSVKTS